MVLRKPHFKAVVKICFSVAILFSLAVGCETASEEDGEEVTFHAFNLEDSETAISLTQVDEDGEELPFPLVAGVSYVNNSEFEERGVVLALMPYDSRGTPIDPGSGWLQIKFNPDETNTVLQAEQISRDAYLYISEVPELGTFQALYFDENTENVPVDGTIRLNQFDFNLSEEYSSLDLDLDFSDLEIGDSPPLSVNGFVDYSAESVTASGDGDADSNELDSDVPGGCGAGYDGPTGDLQWETLCKAAFQYACAGQQDGVNATCANLEGLRELNPGIPACPYCE